MSALQYTIYLTTVFLRKKIALKILWQVVLFNNHLLLRRLLLLILHKLIQAWKEVCRTKHSKWSTVIRDITLLFDSLWLTIVVHINM